MIVTMAKRTADAALGAAKAAAGVARHAAWYVNHHVRGETRPADRAPSERD